MVFCATHVTKCDHLVQGLSNLLPATISTSVLLELLFILSSQSCSMSSSSSSSSQPLAYCHMHCGWFPPVVAPFLVSNSPTLLRLWNHRFTFMLIKFL